ncbi:hypothetical protein ACFQFH_12380 [Halobaculum halobium]|uniref:Uncharacterized protein n=1 Tax=Halobaculum halobium TaxID=3032281 RepID=A0ABD5TGT1_9EURY|nr:hypothetical protein [Halobaculum sp. SYNS20]
MNRRLRIAVVAGLVVLLVAAAVLAFGFWQFTRPVPESYSHTAEYRASVQPNATLTNVTLYLPLPVEAGSSPVGDALADDSPNVVDAPPDWSVEVAQTESGPMLAVSLPTLEPAYRERPPPRPIDPDAETATPGAATATPDPQSTPIRTLDDYRVRVEMAFDEPIDTRSPVGSEPVLRPRFDATETECPFPAPESTVCREFGTRMFLSYDAPADATVEVTVSYEARNEWFAGGWTGNSYRQSTRTVVTGDGPGWVAVRATEAVGEGTYRGAPAVAVSGAAATVRPT